MIPNHTDVVEILVEEDLVLRERVHLAPLVEVVLHLELEFDRFCSLSVVETGLPRSHWHWPRRANFSGPRLYRLLNKQSPLRKLCGELFVFSLNTIPLETTLFFDSGEYEKRCLRKRISKLSFLPFSS